MLRTFQRVLPVKSKAELPTAIIEPSQSPRVRLKRILRADNATRIQSQRRGMRTVPKAYKLRNKTSTNIAPILIVRDTVPSQLGSSQLRPIKGTISSKTILKTAARPTHLSSAYRVSQLVTRELARIYANANS